MYIRGARHGRRRRQREIMPERSYGLPWRLANSGIGAVVIAAVALRVVEPLLVAAWFGVTMVVYVIRFVTYRSFGRVAPAGRAATTPSLSAGLENCPLLTTTRATDRRP